MYIIMAQNGCIRFAHKIFAACLRHRDNVNRRLLFISEKGCNFYHFLSQNELIKDFSDTEDCLFDEYLSLSSDISLDFLTYMFFSVQGERASSNTVSFFLSFPSSNSCVRRNVPRKCENGLIQHISGKYLLGWVYFSLVLTKNENFEKALKITNENPIEEFNFNFSWKMC